MSKKTLYILIAAAVILIGGIAVAVASLYSNTKEKGPAVDPAQFIERHALIEAVPSDAAIVFCAKNFGRALELLGDTTAVFLRPQAGSVGGWRRRRKEPKEE